MSGSDLETPAPNVTTDLTPDFPNSRLASTVEAFSIVAIVGGLITLMLATAAVTLVLVFRQKILSELSKVVKVTPPSCYQWGPRHKDAHADADEPALQVYRGTSSNKDLEGENRVALELMEHQGPDEMGFHVSTDIGDGCGPDEMTAFERDLTSKPLHEQDVADENAGYLTRATYRYDQELMNLGQEKRDLSHLPDADREEMEGCALYDNTALCYDPLDTIEGEIVEEVDYQNVTIIRTQLEESPARGGTEDGRVHSSSDDQEYVDVDMSDEDDLVKSGAVVWFDNPRPQLQQQQQQQQQHRSRPPQANMYTQQDQHDTGDSSIYMNVPSAHSRGQHTPGAEDNTSMDYENVDPRSYKQKHY